MTEGIQWGLHWEWVLGAVLGCLGYFWIFSRGVFWVLQKKHPPWTGLFLLIKGIPLLTLWAVFSKNSSFVVLLSLTLGVLVGVTVFSVGVCFKRFRT